MRRLENLLNGKSRRIIMDIVVSGNGVSRGRARRVIDGGGINCVMTSGCMRDQRSVIDSFNILIGVVREGCSTWRGKGTYFFGVFWWFRGKNVIITGTPFLARVLTGCRAGDASGAGIGKK